MEITCPGLGQEQLTIEKGQEQNPLVLRQGHGWPMVVLKRVLCQFAPLWPSISGAHSLIQLGFMTVVKQTRILIDLDTGIVATLVVIIVLGWVSLREEGNC